jgi:hypothetical protein
MERVEPFTDIDEEIRIEQEREKHAQEAALAQELLRRQIGFEKKGGDKLNGFVDRHSFTWYHMLMLLAVNNVIVVILGATVTSTFMSSSFSPLSDMQADSLVASQAGAQNVMVESKQGTSDLTVRSAGGGNPLKPLDSRLVLEEGGAGGSGTGGLTFSSYGTVETGAGRAMSLRSGAGAQDVMLQPSGGGVVRAGADTAVSGAVDVGGTLRVGPLLRADSDSMSVSVGGLDGGSADLAVSGAVVASGTVTLPDPSAGLSVAGSAELQTGSNITGLVAVRQGTLLVSPSPESGRRLATGGLTARMRIESDGAVFTASNLTSYGSTVVENMVVHGPATFSRQASFGDHPSDRAAVHGAVVFHHSTNIGDESSDTLTVAASSWLKGPVSANGTMTFRGGATLANPDSTIDIGCATSFTGHTSILGGVSFGGEAIGHTSFMSKLTVGPTEANPLLSVDGATGTLSSAGTLTVGAETVVQRFEGRNQADFRAAVQLHNLTTAHQGVDVTGMIQLSNVQAVALDTGGTVTVDSKVFAIGVEGTDARTHPASPGTEPCLHVYHGAILGSNVYDTLQIKSDATFKEAVTIGRRLIVGTIGGGNTLTIRSPTKVQASDLTSKFSIIPASGALQTAGAIQVNGRTTLNDTSVLGIATFRTNVVVGGAASDAVRVQATTTFSAAVTIGQSATDRIFIKGDAQFEESLTAKRDFTVTGHATIGNTNLDLFVINARSTFATRLIVSGNVAFGNDAFNSASSPSTVIKGQLAIKSGATNTLTVEPATGTLTTNGDLSVVGDAQLSNSSTLGSASADSISIRGVSIFSAGVSLGDDPVDAIRLVGQTTFKAPLNMSSTSNLQIVSDIRLGSIDGSSSVTITGLAPLSMLRAVDVAGNLVVGTPTDAGIAPRDVVFTALNTFTAAAGEVWAQGGAVVITSKGSSGQNDCRAAGGAFTVASVSGTSPTTVVLAGATAAATVGNTVNNDCQISRAERAVSSIFNTLSVKNQNQIPTVTMTQSGDMTLTGDVTADASNFQSILISGATTLAGALAVGIENRIAPRDAVFTAANTFAAAAGEVWQQGDAVAINHRGSSGQNDCRAAGGAYTVASVSGTNPGIIVLAGATVAATVGNTVNNVCQVSRVQVNGVSDLLTVYGHSETRGDVHVVGHLTSSEQILFRDSVTMDSAAHLTAGQAYLGVTAVNKTVAFQSEARFNGNAILGDSSGNDLVTMNSQLQVMHNGNKMMSVYPTSIANFPNQGQTTAAGVTLHGQVTIAQSTTVQRLNVHGQTVFRENVTIGHTPTNFVVNGDLTANSDIVFGIAGSGDANSNAAPTTLDIRSTSTLHRTLNPRDVVFTALNTFTAAAGEVWAQGGAVVITSKGSSGQNDCRAAGGAFTVASVSGTSPTTVVLAGATAAATVGNTVNNDCQISRALEVRENTIVGVAGKRLTVNSKSQFNKNVDIVGATVIDGIIKAVGAFSMHTNPPRDIIFTAPNTFTSAAGEVWKQGQTVVISEKQVGDSKLCGAAEGTYTVLSVAATNPATVVLAGGSVAATVGDTVNADCVVSGGLRTMHMDGMSGSILGSGDMVIRGSAVFGAPTVNGSSADAFRLTGAMSVVSGLLGRTPTFSANPRTVVIIPHIAPRDVTFTALNTFVRVPGESWVPNKCTNGGAAATQAACEETGHVYVPGSCADAQYKSQNMCVVTGQTIWTPSTCSSVPPVVGGTLASCTRTGNKFTAGQTAIIAAKGAGGCAAAGFYTVQSVAANGNVVLMITSGATDILVTSPSVNGNCQISRALVTETGFVDVSAKTLALTAETNVTGSFFIKRPTGNTFTAATCRDAQGNSAGNAVNQEVCEGEVSSPTGYTYSPATCTNGGQADSKDACETIEMFFAKPVTNQAFMGGDLQIQGKLNPSDKPLRIGLLYTDVIMGRNGISPNITARDVTFTSANTFTGAAEEIWVRGETAIVTDKATAGAPSCAAAGSYVVASVSATYPGVVVLTSAAPILATAPSVNNDCQISRDPTTYSGVTVEGVTFKDGGFRVAKVGQIQELTAGQGVLVEGAQVLNGGIFLDSHNPGIEPKGEHHLATIINTAHGTDMDGTASSIRSQQFYHHSDGLRHAPVTAGKIQFTTESDWNQNANSHNAFFSLHSAHQGALPQRLKISANGDTTFTADRFAFQAANGNTAIKGDVHVGQVDEDGPIAPRSATFTANNTFSTVAGEVWKPFQTVVITSNNTGGAHNCAVGGSTRTILTVSRASTPVVILTGGTDILPTVTTPGSELNDDCLVSRVHIQDGQRHTKVISTGADSTVHISSYRGAGKTARLTINGDYAESRLVAKAGQYARVVLQDEREFGYAWSRYGADNVLSLDLIERGQGLVARALVTNLNELIAKVIGNFANVKVGDYILTNEGCATSKASTCIDGEMKSRIVTSVSLGADNGVIDKLVVFPPFTAAFEDKPYYVARRISSVTDDNTAVFGGATGDKSFNIKSSDTAAALRVAAGGGKSSAQVTGDDDAELTALAGQNANARTCLEEQAGRGYMLWRGSGADNKLYLLRTVLSSRRIAVAAGVSQARGSGAGGVVDDVAVGDYLIVQVGGVDAMRKVTAVDRTRTIDANADIVTVESRFDDINSNPSLSYKVARPVLTVNDDNHVVFGDTSSAKSLTLTSLDAAVEQILEANGINANEAAMTINSGQSNTAAELQCGSNAAARLKLYAKNDNVGYTMSRSTGNKFAIDYTLPGLGGTISVVKGLTTVTSSGLLFVSLKKGDHIIVVLNGVEYSREVTAAPCVVTCDPHEATIDRMFSSTVDIVNSAYRVGRRVIQFSSKDAVVIGGNSGPKTLSLSSTDEAVSVAIAAAGSGKEGSLRITSEDAVELALTSGAGKDVEFALSDSTGAGYTFTRSTISNELLLQRTKAGPGGVSNIPGTITVAANSATVQGEQMGAFSSDVAVGDSIVVLVTCSGGTNCGAKQSRKIVAIAANGGSLTVATPFSTDTAITASKFTVTHKLLSVNQNDQVTYGDSSGDKTLIIDSADDDAQLLVTSLSTNSIAKLDIDGDIALLDASSAAGKATKVKMQDRDIEAGFVLVRDSRPMSCRSHLGARSPLVPVIAPSNLEWSATEVVNGGQYAITDACATANLNGQPSTCTSAGNCIYRAGPPESCISACSSMALHAVHTGTGTITQAATSTLVTADDSRFGAIKPGDHITTLIDGVEITRTVISVNTLQQQHRLTLDETFSSTTSVSAQSYVVQRPILSVTNEDTVVIGASSGAKELRVSSSDAAVELDVIAKGSPFESRMKVESENRGSIVVQAGLDSDAVLHLSTASKGFALSRRGEQVNSNTVTNQLFVERTVAGTGLISCPAASTVVTAQADGQFASLRVGDRLVVMFNGVEIVRLISVVNPNGAQPDILSVSAAFHSTQALTSQVFSVHRSTATVSDDDTVLFGGNSGTKQMLISSLDSGVDVKVLSGGSPTTARPATHAAELDIVSQDYSNLKLVGSNDKDARLYLTDAAGTGFMLRKSQGTTNALKGSSYAASANALTIEETITITAIASAAHPTFPIPTVDVAANTKRVVASGDGEFATIFSGDFITIIPADPCAAVSLNQVAATCTNAGNCVHKFIQDTAADPGTQPYETCVKAPGAIYGTEIQRMVTQTAKLGNPDELTVDSAFHATENIDNARYFITRPLLAFNDFHRMLVGGREAAAQVDIVSTHESATLTVQASDSPVHCTGTYNADYTQLLSSNCVGATDNLVCTIGQCDSTGQRGHADVRAVSDSIATLGAYVEANQDARIRMQDTVNRDGYMFARIDGIDGVSPNKLINFRTKLGPGVNMYCQAGSTIVTSSNAVNAFETVEPGDYVMVYIDATSVGYCAGWQLGDPPCANDNNIADGIEVIRKIVNVIKNTTTDKIVVEAPFSATIAIVNQPFELVRPVETLKNDGTYRFGGTSQQKSFTIESTTASSSLSVLAYSQDTSPTCANTGTCTRSEFNIVGQDTIEVDFSAAAGVDVQLKLRDDTDGFVFARDGANQVFTLSQTVTTVGAGLSALAGSTTVTAAQTGGFTSVQVGDRIVVNVAGEDEARLVTAKASVDSVTVASQFSAGAISTQPFVISRRATTIDSTTFTLFGTNGAKTMSLQSLDDRVDIDFRAGQNVNPQLQTPAVITLQSQQLAVLRVQCGSDEKAKLKLEDRISRNGFSFERGGGDTNKFGLDRMQPGTGTITQTSYGATTTIQSSGTHFGNLAEGDMISVVVGFIPYIAPRDVLFTSQNIFLAAAGEVWALGQTVIITDKESGGINNCAAGAAATPNEYTVATVTPSPAGAIVQLTAATAIAQSVPASTAWINTPLPIGVPVNNNCQLSRKQVNGVEETRTIVSPPVVSSGQHTVTVSSMFSVGSVVNSEYQVVKRVMSIETSNHIVFGGIGGSPPGSDRPGDKVLELSSTANSAELKVTGGGTCASASHCLGAVAGTKMLSSKLYIKAGEEATVTVGSGTDHPAAMLLRDSVTYRGFGFTRQTRSSTLNNVLQLHRSTDGPGVKVIVGGSASPVVAAAGGLYVHSVVSGSNAFATINVGDEIVIDVVGVEKISAITQVFLNVQPNYVKVADAFSSTIVLDGRCADSDSTWTSAVDLITTSSACTTAGGSWTAGVSFHIRRKVLSITDDNTMTFGGSYQDKMMSISAIGEGSATLALSSAGAQEDGYVSLNSGGAECAASLVSATSKEARVSLADSSYGYTLARETVASTNSLSLTWTKPGPGSTVTVVGDSVTVTSNNAGSNPFASVQIGEVIAIERKNIKLTIAAGLSNPGGTAAAVGTAVTQQTSGATGKLRAVGAIGHTELFITVLSGTFDTVPTNLVTVSSMNPAAPVALQTSSQRLTRKIVGVTTATSTLTVDAAFTTGSCSTGSHTTQGTCTAASGAWTGGVDLAGVPFELGKRVLSVEQDGEELRVGGPFADTACEAADISSGSPATCGTATCGPSSCGGSSSQCCIGGSPATCPAGCASRQACEAGGNVYTPGPAEANCVAALSSSGSPCSFTPASASGTPGATAKAICTTAAGSDTTSVAVSGGVEMAGMLTVKSQTVPASAAIPVTASHLLITPVSGVQANRVSIVRAPQPGTLLLVENRDDNDTTGAIACPGGSRCVFVYGSALAGASFKLFAPIKRIV